MTTILPVFIKSDYANYNEAANHLASQDVKHLGWLNEGIKLPNDCVWSEVYSNNSGSSCIFVEKTKRLAYSVDMGD